MATILQAQALCKTFGAVTAADNINVSIESDTVVGLIGTNGAGKTTFVNMVTGYLTPTSGSIRFLDRDITGLQPRVITRLGISRSFQIAQVFGSLTVAENLLVYGRYFAIKDSLIRARIPELLDFAGLGGRHAARIQALSGGMKRRLTLARALINDPDVVFLDEPTTGLDPQARHLIWDRLKQLTARGKTLILTTHFMDEAERLCDRLAVLDRGRLVTEGAPRELIAAHVEPQVVEVFGDDVGGWARTHTALGERLELAGETAFFYCRDPAPLLAALASTPSLRYLHRAASLEDVFIKLTGRELRD